MKEIYLNYAATTPVKKEVLQAYLNTSEKYFGYPGVNQRETKLQEEVRAEFLKYFKADNKRLVFTSGASEANNLAILGYAKKFTKAKHFITSIYEHSSVYGSFVQLEKLGHEVSFVKPNKQGIIEVEEVVKLVQDNTVLVSIMHVNNELGTINDIELIAQEVKQINPNIAIMTDNVQGLNYFEPLDLTNIDFMTVTSHKIYGPKACGLLLYTENIGLQPVTYGGMLENGLRAGVQSLPAQVGFLKALKLLDVREERKKVENIRNYFLSKMEDVAGVVINTIGLSMVNIQLSINLQGESIVSEVYKRGIVISSRSSCSTATKSLSRALVSIALSDEEVEHSLRISFSSMTLPKEIDRLQEVFKELIEEFGLLK